MRLQDNPYLPVDSIQSLVRQLNMLINSIHTQVNGVTEGRASAITNAATAAPTGAVTSYNLGDFILNSAPSELGSVGSKYIIHGWRCVAAGAPGTWVQCRFLTGS